MVELAVEYRETWVENYKNIVFERDYLLIFTEGQMKSDMID